MTTPSFYSIAIFVTDLPRAIDFYGTRLGLPVVKQGSFGAEIFEQPSHIGIHPAVHPDAQKLVGRHTGITLHVPGLLHYCGQLHDRGVRFMAEPTQQGWGIMAMIADPDGNILALWEESPEGAHAEPHPQ